MRKGSFFKKNYQRRIGISILAILATLSGIPSLGQENLLQNSGFELTGSNKQIENWSLFCTPGMITATDKLAYSGKNSLMIRVQQTKTTPRVSQTIPIIKPGCYELQFAAKIIGNAQFYITWSFVDEQGKKITVKRNYSKIFNEFNAIDWTSLKTKIEVPLNAKKITINFYFNLIKNGTDGTVFIDDVSLMPEPEKKVYENNLSKDAKLVLHEDFSSGVLPPKWKIVRGEWKVVNNALHGASNGLIFYTGKLESPNMRVEYVAWSDTPADLSVVLGQDMKSDKINGIFFGFGSQNNTINQITKGNLTLAKQGGALEVFSNPIQAGRKHRVIAERNYNHLKLWVDGKLILEGEDPFFSDISGESFGFYIWSKGCIDDVKVYSLPSLLKDNVPQEQPVEFQSYEGFEGYSTGADKAGFQILSGQPILQIVDIPTWIYKTTKGNKFVKDNCLEIITKEEKTQVSKSFEPLKSGIIEFDIFAEDKTEFKIAILDHSGKEILNLIISKDGRFMTEDKKGRRVLREKIRYQRRAFDADFRFMPNRWYTFRMQFGDKCQEIVLINHYSETKDTFALGKAGEYLPLDVRFDDTIDSKGESFVIKTEGEGRICLDNLIILGPVGKGNINGKPKTLSSAEILGLSFPARKDPVSLKLASYRHITTNALRITPLLRHYFSVLDNAPEYKNFKPAGSIYNQALISLAFFEEKINMLQRSACYLEESKSGIELKKLLLQLEATFKRAEQLQENALKSFAAAYLDAQNGQKLGPFHEAMNAIRITHALMNEEIEKCLKLLKTDSASEQIISCPLPNTNEKIVWNKENKRWEKDNVPSVYNYFSFASSQRLHWDDLKMLGFQNYRDDGCGYKAFPSRFRPGIDPVFKDGEYINLGDGNWAWLKSLHESGRRGLMLSSAGLNYAVTGAPKWWYEKYKSEDIIFSSGSGTSSKAPAWRNFYSLNWWHPEVKKLIREEFSAVGKEALKYKDAISIIQIGWELTSALPGGCRPGFNPSALCAFRNMLKEKYHNINNLNSLWNTNYKSFDSIFPPEGKEAPSGVQYEFRKFVQDGFSEWLKNISDAIHKNIPDVPTAIDSQCTFDENPVALFRAADIKLYHSYQAWDRKLVDRWHSQLGAVLNTPFGTKEWIPSQGTPYMFQMDKIRNNCLREKAMLMMWGGVMFEFYGWGGGNWQYDLGFHEARLDRLVFNYIAPMYPLYMDRIKRIGLPALTIPLTKPNIGLLEVTSSHYNGLNPRAAMRAIACELTETGWDFEFLYEQLIQEKQQSLAGTEVLFVPSGICMPVVFSDLIYEWVKAGGKMICTQGPAGILNQYGQPTNRLEKIFNGNWRMTKNGLWEIAEIKPFYCSGNIKAWQVNYGKGKIIVFNHLDPHIYDLMGKLTEKQFGSDEKTLQFCMRSKDGEKYLYILNWSDNQTVEATVFLKGNYDSIVDLGLQLPLQVPVKQESGKTFFRTRLAPGEITLLHITENKDRRLSLHGGL